MQITLVFSTVFLAALLPWQANAGTVNFSFAGPGVSGTIALTYGPATDGKYSQAFEATGIIQPRISKGTSRSAKRKQIGSDRFRMLLHLSEDP
jgi:hypothetical protein